MPGQTDPVYYLADALGSTTDLADPVGAVLKSYSYDAFGALRPKWPNGGAVSLANTYLFASENADANTGLVYLRARYYDAATGRFVSKDPTGFADGTNLYVYVQDDPVNRADPSGLVAPLIPGLVGAYVGVAGYYLTTPASKRTMGGAARAAGVGFVGAYTRVWGAIAQGLSTYIDTGSVRHSLFDAGAS